MTEKDLIDKSISDAMNLYLKDYLSCSVRSLEDYLHEALRSNGIGLLRPVEEEEATE